MSTLIAVALRPALWIPLGRYLVVVWRDFFWPQYHLRAFPRGRVIVPVDGALDARIPFRPEIYPKYLSFVSLWIDTLGFTRARAGAAAFPLWLQFLEGLEALYLDAGAISKAHPTTTTRPAGLRGPRMALIKWVDPHYHCLPSLHILVIAYTHLKYQEWRPLLGQGPEAGAWDDYLRKEMLEIAESVLYVKQHSVSCIAGSLFFLTARFPEADEAFAEAFIQALFEAENDVPAEEIRAFIGALYRELLRRHRAEGVPAAQVLTEFIRSL